MTFWGFCANLSQPLTALEGFMSKNPSTIPYEENLVAIFLAQMRWSKKQVENEMAMSSSRHALVLKEREALPAIVKALEAELAATKACPRTREGLGRLLAQIGDKIRYTVPADLAHTDSAGWLAWATEAQKDP